jgi:dienelactone hydrolase
VLRSPPDEEDATVSANVPASEPPVRGLLTVLENFVASMAISPLSKLKAMGRASLLLVAALLVPVSAGITVTPDQAFAGVDGQIRRWDLYRPAEWQPGDPALVAIHGGGGRHGDEDDIAGLATRWAEMGYLVAAPDYRLFPDGVNMTAAQLDAQVTDIHAAVDALRGFGPGNVGAFGTSWGGVLATYVTAYGYADTGVSISGGFHQSTTPALGSARPLYLAHSQNDTVYPARWSKQAAAAYATAGRPYRLDLRPGSQHGRKLWATDPTIRADAEAWFALWLSR